LRAAIEAAWGVPVLDHYGQTEMGLAGAVECRERDGAHLRAADLIAEILDPSGQRLPAGSRGELVLTSLTRRAMPLIRYRTGDLARLERTPCPCGSVMERVIASGRLRDVMRVGDRELGLVELGEALYAREELAGFRAALRPGPFLRVAVIPPQRTGPSAAAAVAAAGEALAGLLGGDLAFEVVAADPERSAGRGKPVLER
jgi:phenylacetate-coenzyme A ligase PaaK-like adenylate-forming protein